MIGADTVPPRRQWIGDRVRSALDREPESRAARAKRRALAGRDGLNAANLPEPGEQPIDEQRPDTRTLDREILRDGKRDHAVGIEAGIDAVQRRHAPEHEPRGGDEAQRCGHLHDQQHALAEAGPARGRPIAAALERRDEVAA